MRSEDENTALKVRLRTLWVATCDVLEPSPAIMDHKAENDHADSVPGHEHNNQHLNQRSLRKRYRGGWDYAAFGCSVGSAVPLGICTAFFEHHFLWFLGFAASGTLLIGTAGLSFWRNKVLQRRETEKVIEESKTEGGEKEQEREVRKIVENYQIRDAARPARNNTSRINTLVESGIAALESNEEIFKVFERLEKYGVPWPDLWRSDPKTILAKLASTGTTLHHEVDIGDFIMTHLPPRKLPSSSPEEKAAQRRAGS